MTERIMVLLTKTEMKGRVFIEKIISVFIIYKHCFSSLREKSVLMLCLVP